VTLVAEGVAVGVTGVGVCPQMGTVIGRGISGVDIRVSPPPDGHPTPLQAVGSRVGSKHKVGTGVNVWVAVGVRVGVWVGVGTSVLDGMGVGEIAGVKVGVCPQMGTVIGRDISGVDIRASPPPDWHPAPLQTVGSRVGSKHRVGADVKVWVAVGVRLGVRVLVGGSVGGSGVNVSVTVGINVFRGV